MFNSYFKNSLAIVLTVLFSAGVIFGQTSGFTYQGRLTDGGSPANGNYDLQFALYDAADGNNQIGQTQVVSSVPVNSGIFTVTLDFGPSAFSGANRFLEISARPSGAPAFTLMTPRQPITATPYAVRSSSAASADNAQQLAGVAANQYVKTDDARMADARDPKAGNSNYVQNSTNQQASANFNISGNGTAAGTLSGNTVNSVTQYNLSGQKVLGLTGAHTLKLNNDGPVSIGPSIIGGYQLEVESPDKFGLRVGAATPGGAAFSVGGTGDFAVDSANLYGGRFVVKENGNVGIGTSNPPYKLTVAGGSFLGGDVTVGGTLQSTGGFKFPDASVQTNAVGKTFTGFTSANFEILHSDFLGTIVSTVNAAPPGVYLLTATVAFENEANGGLFANNTRVVRCSLGNDSWTIGLGAPGSALEFATLTVHTVFIQPVESQITLTCGSRDAVGQVFVHARRVTAIRMGDNPSISTP